jgi:mRNA interferase RelE/StbE
MASFSLAYKPSVKRDLERIHPSARLRLLARCRELADDPLSRQSRRVLGAQGARRVRVGDYRVVCEVDTAARRVIVSRIRHRKDAYRGM